MSKSDRNGRNGHTKKVVVVSRDMNNIAEKKSSELEVNFALMFANIRE